MLLKSLNCQITTDNARYYQSFAGRNEADELNAGVAESARRQLSAAGKMQTENTRRLSDRVKDINGWKMELERAIKDMIEETEQLFRLKTRLESSLRSLEVWIVCCWQTGSEENVSNDFVVVVVVVDVVVVVVVVDVVVVVVVVDVVVVVVVVDVVVVVVVVDVVVDVVVVDVVVVDDDIVIVVVSLLKTLKTERVVLRMLLVVHNLFHLSVPMTSLWNCGDTLLLPLCH